MFCTQRSVKRQNDGWKWTQMHPIWKYRWMNQKMFDEKFDQEQTSSNIIQHDFFLLFYFFLNFESSKIFDVGWNVGCICTGLYQTSGLSKMWNQFISILGCWTISLSDSPDVELLRCSFVWHFGSLKFLDKCTFGQVRFRTSDMGPLLITS